jgi:hypothetical protein
LDAYANRNPDSSSIDCCRGLIGEFRHVTFYSAWQSASPGLNATLMEKGRTFAERNNIESEIRATQLVLDHYLRALQLEREPSLF